MARQRSKPKRTSSTPATPKAPGSPGESGSPGASGTSGSSPRDRGVPPSDGPDWRTLHLWEIQPLRDLLVLAAVFGLFYLGYVLRAVTIPILLAMALAYLFEPIVAAVTRRGWLSRANAAAGLIVLAGAVFVVPAVLSAGFAAGQAFRFWDGPGDRPGFGERLVSLTKSIETQVVPVDEERVGDAGEAGEGSNGGFFATRNHIVRERTEEAAAVRDELPERWRWVSDKVVAGKNVAYLGDFLASARSWVAPKTLAGVSATLGAIVSLGMLCFGTCLTAFFFYFFCTGYGALLSFWEGLIPERKRGRVIDLAHQMDRVIAGFIRGRVLVGVFMAVFYAVGFAALGVPAALILGPIVGLLSILPYVSLIGVPISIVLLWLEPGDALMDGPWFTVIAPIALYGVGQFLDDYVLSPVIQRRATAMDTPSIVFASLAGAMLAGIYGVLIAIPAAACVKILLRELFWPRFRAWAEGRERDFLPIGE